MGTDSLDGMALDYISYSQYKSYSCPRNWYLGKLRDAEPRQTWYIPVGSAVHQMIEKWIEQGGHTASEFMPKAEDFFYPLIEAQMAVEPDLSKWLAGGPKDSPIVQEKALQLVRDCFEQAITELSEIDVWEVEFDASGRLPGLEVPVKGFVDIIGEHPKKGPVIWDWKTGSTKPDNFQLETYAALLLSHDPDCCDHVRNWSGRYVMLAPGTPNTRYVDLSKVDPTEVGAKYQAVYERMKAKQYEAKPGFGCQWCFNQDNCLVNAGMTRRAVYYDKSEEDGIPF